MLNLCQIEKSLKFSINLIGYDGTLKKKFDTLEPKEIFELIDSMPMSFRRDVNT